MKKKIIDFGVPFLGAVLLGFICGKVVYKIYQSDIEKELKSSKLYLVQGGEYLTYDNMREENNGTNYIYYKDEDGYKTVLGITNDKNNIDKIKKLYTNDMKVNEYYISTELLNNKQKEYDNELAMTNDIYEVREVVNNILNLYRNDDNVKLVLIK